MGVLARETLIKQPAESILYSIDFSELLESSETISEVASVTATPAEEGDELTIASEAIGEDTTSIEFRVSGGTDGSNYRIEAKVTTSAGNTREGDAALQVRD